MVFTVQELDCIGALSFLRFFRTFFNDFDLSKRDKARALGFVRGPKLTLVVLQLSSEFFHVINKTT